MALYVHARKPLEAVTFRLMKAIDSLSSARGPQTASGSVPVTVSELLRPLWMLLADRWCGVAQLGITDWHVIANDAKISGVCSH